MVAVQATNIPPKETVLYTKQTQTTSTGGGPERDGKLLNHSNYYYILLTVCVCGYVGNGVSLVFSSIVSSLGVCLLRLSTIQIYYSFPGLIKRCCNAGIVVPLVPALIVFELYWRGSLFISALGLLLWTMAINLRDYYIMTMHRTILLKPYFWLRNQGQRGIGVTYTVTLVFIFWTDSQLS